MSGHIPLYNSIGMEGWINRWRRDPGCQQLGVKDYPWDLGTTELRYLDSSDLAHFDDYPTSHCDHVDDRNSLLASCRGESDQQTSTLVVRLAATAVWGIERPSPVWGNFFANWVVSGVIHHGAPGRSDRS